MRSKIFAVTVLTVLFTFTASPTFCGHDGVFVNTDASGTGSSVDISPSFNVSCSPQSPSGIVGLSDTCHIATHEIKVNEPAEPAEFRMVYKAWYQIVGLEASDINRVFLKTSITGDSLSGVILGNLSTIDTLMVFFMHPPIIDVPTGGDEFKLYLSLRASAHGKKVQAFFYDMMAETASGPAAPWIPGVPVAGMEVEIVSPLPLSVPSSNRAPPEEYELSPNYPNPFNPETTIDYIVAESGIVRLSIYTLTGQRIRTLVNDEERHTGFYSVTWDGRDDSGRDVASGVYLYQLDAGSFTRTRRMVLVR